MTLKRLFRLARLVQQQQALIQAQSLLIQKQQTELQEIRLGYLKEMEGIVAAWVIHTDQPELDLRPDLVDLMTTLGHHVAILEEHVV